MLTPFSIISGSKKYIQIQLAFLNKGKKYRIIHTNILSLYQNTHKNLFHHRIS